MQREQLLLQVAKEGLPVSSTQFRRYIEYGFFTPWKVSMGKNSGVKAQFDESTFVFAKLKLDHFSTVR